MREARARHAKLVYREYLIHHELRPGTRVFVLDRKYKKTRSGLVERLEYMPFHYKDGGYFNCTMKFDDTLGPKTYTFPNETYELQLAQQTFWMHLINRPMDYW